MEYAVMAFVIVGIVYLSLDQYGSLSKLLEKVFGGGWGVCSYPQGVCSCPQGVFSCLQNVLLMSPKLLSMSSRCFLMSPGRFLRSPKCFLKPPGCFLMSPGCLLTSPGCFCGPQLFLIWGGLGFIEKVCVERFLSTSRAYSALAG